MTLRFPQESAPLNAERDRHLAVLAWHYGPLRALAIIQGRDEATEIDRAKWAALGRKA